MRTHSEISKLCNKSQMFVINGLTMRRLLVCVGVALLVAAASPSWAQTTWYVDDDAVNDPGAGDPAVSDPLEDGSLAHPFDAIQEAIDASAGGDTVLVSDGTYTGLGNRDLDFGGRAIAVRSENGPETCIIDCEQEGRGFYFHNDELTDSVVEGVTITSGLANADSPGYSCGGGILCHESSPTISGCVLRACSATGDGGGIACYSSDAIINDSTIVNNYLRQFNCMGGGICCDGGAVTINRCLIDGNESACLGGGVSSSGGAVTVSECVIRNNTAPLGGGGIRCTYSHNVLIENSTITDNRASGMADDLYTYGGGGGVYCHDSSFRIVESVIARNESWLFGGGVYSSDDDYSDIFITHCIIADNHAAELGGGVYSSFDVVVSSSILWNNAPDQISGEPTVSYCDVQGGWDGEGVIDADPMFALEDNYRLRGGSACIDAGDNDPPGGYPAIDPEGVARPLDGDGDSIAVPDIGVYEYPLAASAIALAETEYSFYASIDGENPIPEMLDIRNCGGETLNWAISNPCSWLDVTPSSGESDGEIDEAILAVNITGLTHGVYVCDVEVSDTQAANSPRKVRVELHLSHTFRVPSEYPTIRAAMDAATVKGDVVLVADGVYRGADNKNLRFRGKDIFVRSENGPLCCIIDCEADQRAFRFDAGETDAAELRGFTIMDGRATNGAGIQCVGSVQPTINDCVMVGCETPWQTPGGRGGGVDCRYFASPTLVNCAIIGCYARSGGGVFARDLSRPVLMNCTIIANTSGVFAGLDEFNQLEKTLITMSNCLIWDTTEGPPAAGDVVAEYCCIQGGWEGEGNIDADPQFVDPVGADGDPDTWEDNDYRLSHCSPCIDAGNNDAVPPDTFDLDGDGDVDEPLPFDLDGYGRFFDDPYTPDTGSGTPPIVDMGAYEYGSGEPPCPADIDGDRDVDLSDLAILLGYYGMTSGAQGYNGDLDCDGDVDLSDLATVLGWYGSTCECT